ncbi:MAG: glutaminyl-peptide cyclotransferase [Bacteroidales bacterium]|jgi:glutaminyl-peptide cyclotransferase|nr:glutaminyl-peptide cyclotransferase [Bacteroidales bacterium]HPJ83093.1 glutaminyl-peptide cyclotransferase [Bacteroidales bacterium]
MIRQFLIKTLLVSATFAATASAVSRYSYKIEDVMPHNISAYTQGFFYHEGFFYESTGQYGSSTIAKLDMTTGKVLRSQALERSYFGEGACIHNGLIYQLTWTQKTCFVYDADTFKLLGTRRYNREGWGLTTNGKELIMSDGSSTLYIMDPETLLDKRSVKVTLNGKEVNYLNELEYIEGEVWANLYMSDEIVRIDPATGKVTGVIDLKGILPMSLRKPTTDVLNGIAYDPQTKSIWITGKYWPRVYKISLH